MFAIVFVFTRPKFTTNWNIVKFLFVAAVKKKLDNSPKLINIVLQKKTVIAS